MAPEVKLFLRWVSRDGKLIILSRGICSFAQSSVSVILALYLDKLGFSLIQIGAFLSAGVAGSAFLAFIVSLIAEKVGRRLLLVTFALMSGVAGLALVFVNDFLPLMFVAFLGSITGGVGGHLPSHWNKRVFLIPHQQQDGPTSLLFIVSSVWQAPPWVL